MICGFCEREMSKVNIRWLNGEQFHKWCPSLPYEDLISSDDPIAKEALNTKFEEDLAHAYGGV